jgi:hypothetical protein
MSEAIVAVGGTGKRVAALYLKLVNTLLPANAVRPGSNVFVIDMEPETGTTDDELNRELQGEGVPASHFISPVLEDVQAEPNTTLSQFMNFEAGGAVLLLAHSLFNTTQLNVQIIRGMNCEPTVGATVAARKFKVDAGKQEDDVQSLQDGIAGLDRVIIVGSIVGGTGAGVTPQLVKWLRQRVPAKPVYGLLFMRWLDLPQNDQDGPTNVKMYGNAKAWLNYLIEHDSRNTSRRVQRELFTHYVLVGAPRGMALNGSDTRSHHPLHLLGAYYLLQFDNLQERTPGATGPHYFQLDAGIPPQDINMGEATMAAAIVWEKLLIYMLGVFRAQRPDQALSPFTLMLRDRLAWPEFIRTMEEFAATRGRRGQLRRDWEKIANVFEQERKRAEARIEDLKKLTSTMPGADEIFNFDWNELNQRYETKKPDALALTRSNLRRVTVPSDEIDEDLKSVARMFIGQLRDILRKYIKP